MREAFGLSMNLREWTQSRKHSFRRQIFVVSLSLVLRRCEWRSEIGRSHPCIRSRRIREKRQVVAAAGGLPAFEPSEAPATWIEIAVSDVLKCGRPS
jgi:hypothetical protein